MQKMLLGLAEDGVVLSLFLRQLLRVCFPLQRKTKEMTFARIATATDDNRAVRIVHIDELLDMKIGRSHCAHEFACGGTQFDLPSPVALGGPKKLAAVLHPDWHWLLIEIHPCGVSFTQELPGRPGLVIDRQQELFLLGAILDDDAERSGGLFPDDPREIRILFPIPFDPPSFAARSRHNS